MRTFRKLARWLPVALLAPILAPVFGGDKSKSQKPDKPDDPPEAVAIIDRIVAGERIYDARLRSYSPRLETYVQYYNQDSDLGEVPRKDAYFLGRLAVEANAKEISFIPDSFLDWLRRRPDVFLKHLHLNEFAVEPLAVDPEDFDRDHYVFDPVRWEKLGDVRCLAIDVHPRQPSQGRPFQGRIWVKENDYTIVRLNGTRLNPPYRDVYVHFDCWRENLRPGLWLPVYIFSQETDGSKRFRYKAETRLWGYGVTPWRPPENHTREQAKAAKTSGPFHLRRKQVDEMSNDEARQRLDVAAEHNVVKRLERAGLIAPPGPVDRVLDTVVNNLRVTNHLENSPVVDCRVLLTSTLESFSLAHTIVLSRGLIDVLPDEPSLAMVLAHELAHITLHHKLNTQYALENGIDVADEKLLGSMDLARDGRDEIAADAKGMEFLKKSPYKDSLGQAGVFLEQATLAARNSPRLFGGHLGNGLTEGGYKNIRMAALTTGAPALKPKNVDQIAALPLGSRVQVNAWDETIAFSQRKSPPLIAPSEKMPFQVTPVVPYLKIFAEPAKVIETSQR